MKLALVIAAAITAGQPQQFDLVCTGQWRFQLFDPFEPHNFRLRVDLDRKLWCEDACKALKPIAEVQPAFIAFEQESPEEKVRRWSHSRVVSRETGKFLAYIRDDRSSVINIEAQCEPAPFSGFPDIRTKF